MPKDTNDNLPFSGLTFAEQERLQMLIEEAGEIVQAGTKILRHGYESHHPEGDIWWTNRKHLLKEVGDLYAVLKAMEDEGDVTLSSAVGMADAVWQRKLSYTHHQKGSPK